MISLALLFYYSLQISRNFYQGVSAAADWAIPVRKALARRVLQSFSCASKKVFPLLSFTQPSFHFSVYIIISPFIKSFHKSCKFFILPVHEAAFPHHIKACTYAFLAHQKLEQPSGGQPAGSIAGAGNCCTIHRVWKKISFLPAIYGKGF